MNQDDVGRLGITMPFGSQFQVGEATITIQKHRSGLFRAIINAPRSVKIQRLAEEAFPRLTENYKEQQTKRNHRTSEDSRDD